MFEFWADIINGFFPFQANTFPSPAYLFANGASPGEQRACLTAMLSSGALAKIIHLIVAPSPVPDRSAAYAWADKEAELRPALAAAFFALPNREKRGIYGLIAIGDFVRLYEYTLAGEFKPIFFPEGKQTLHTVVDGQHISRALQEIQKLWIKEDTLVPFPLP